MDTIFALSTVFGKSGVAVIRISGTESLKTPKHLNASTNQIKNRYATFVKIHDSLGNIIDEVIMIYFEAPKSFTGEDVLEIHTHGSIAVINSIQSELSKYFRMANPGEFTQRAFLNGKIDLTKAEAISDIINSHTKKQLVQATSQLNGHLSKVYIQWRESLIQIYSLVEAYIDFPDEDIPSSITLRITKQIDRLISSMQSYIQDQRIGEKIREGLKVAIIGAPNAGKSSLFNHILGKKIAIVSNIAGTTRDSIEIITDICGYQVSFIDTAGLRDSNDIIEIEGVKIAEDHAQNVDYKIAMFSCEQLPNIDYKTEAFVDSNNTICVASKSDLLGEELPKTINIHDKKLITISVYKNYGIEELITQLTKMIKECMSTSEPPIITRERHRIAIELSLASLKAFNLNDIELASENLRIAIKQMSIIVGKITLEDVLSEIFSKFCIGK